MTVRGALVSRFIVVDFSVEDEVFFFSLGDDYFIAFLEGASIVILINSKLSIII